MHRANNILSGNLAGEKNAPGLPVQWCEAVCVCACREAAADVPYTQSKKSLSFSVVRVQGI
jgi:hypothetical protein